jgi:hypothetical protein
LSTTTPHYETEILVPKPKKKKKKKKKCEPEIDTKKMVLTAA